MRWRHPQARLWFGKGRAGVSGAVKVRHNPYSKSGVGDYHRVGRVLGFFSSRRNWDSPTPFAAGGCAPPLFGLGGRAHSLAREGLGESQFRRLEKSLALCLLCGSPPRHTVVLYIQYI
jgi:hypothetical protein